VGIGVEIEQTYSFLLAERIGKKVLNASVTGYGIVDYVEVVRALANKVKPELVIVGICLNDVATGSQAGIIAMVQNTKAEEKAIPDERRYPNRVVRMLRYINDNYFNFNNFLKSYSRAYLFIKSLASDTSRDYFSADSVFYQDPKTIEFLSSQFTELKTLLTDETALVLVIFPYEYQLRAGSPHALEPQTRIKEAGLRAGVAIYDLYDELVEYLKVNRLSSKSIYLFNDPMHFNSLGHHAIAEYLYRYIDGKS
jgi:lysophospholipase L1-like esterase